MNRNLPTYDAAEQRNKLSHFTTQGFDLNGIVQAGAHDGEELRCAIDMGVEHYVAFEPFKEAFSKLNQIVMPLDYHIYSVGLHNETTTAKLNVAGGDGKGSSIFETEFDHPEVKANWNQGQAEIVGSETIGLLRFDYWATLHPQIDLSNYNTLQLDTQGNEMEILEGMGDYLQGFKYLCIELSKTPVYRGETPGNEVAAWLRERGFTLDSPIYEHNDSFFVRSDIKPTSEEVYRGRC